MLLVLSVFSMGRPVRPGQGGDRPGWHGLEGGQGITTGLPSIGGNPPGLVRC